MSLSPYWSDDQVTLHLGDCLEVLAEMEAASVDAIVTDPPYGLEFMGREWDVPYRLTGFRRSRNEAGRRTRQRVRPHEPPHVAGVLAQASRLSNARESASEFVRAHWNPLRGPQVGVHAPPSARRTSRAPRFRAWCEEWARECLRVLKPGGPTCWRSAGRGRGTASPAGLRTRGSISGDSVADLTGRTTRRGSCGSREKASRSPSTRGERSTCMFANCLAATALPNFPPSRGQTIMCARSRRKVTRGAATERHSSQRGSQS